MCTDKTTIKATNSQRQWLSSEHLWVKIANVCKIDRLCSECEAKTRRRKSDGCSTFNPILSFFPLLCTFAIVGEASTTTATTTTNEWMWVGWRGRESIQDKFPSWKMNRNWHGMEAIWKWIESWDDFYFFQFLLLLLLVFDSFQFTLALLHGSSIVLMMLTILRARKLLESCHHAIWEHIFDVIEPLIAIFT